MNYCSQCNLSTDAIVCAGCHQYLTEDRALIDAHLSEPPIPPFAVKWGTCFSHWGDTIAGLSIARATLDRIGQKSCNMLHLGPDPDMGEFLRAQPWIDEVIACKPKEYLQIEKEAAKGHAAPGEWMPMARDIPGLPNPSDVWPTHLNQTWAGTYRCEPLPSAKLPAKRRQWARAAHKAHKGPGKTFLLHPVSLWSATAREHWPYWQKAVKWLLQKTPHTYLLTGLERIIEWEHPRLIDLVGRIPTNMELMAISELCDGVIGTCNNLALWTVVQDRPGLIMGNAAIRNHVNYFRRFIDRAPNVYQNVDASFPDFVESAERWTENPREVSGYRGQLQTPRRVAVDSRRTFYRVVRGIVSGRGQDYFAGAVVEASELNGDPAAYVSYGLLEKVRVNAHA